MPDHKQSLPFVIRSSRIHGKGAFATRRIRKGSRIIEYAGERISNEEADRRYPDNGGVHHHTFLFALDEHSCIDAGRKGNVARFINHSCDPNCESVEEAGRIYIEATRNIQPGAELSYDYQFRGPALRTIAEQDFYACRCGAPNCSGTMYHARARRNHRRKTKARARGL